jgi:flagellar motor protein MotB
MLSTLAFAGGCGYYFLEYQKARLDLAAYDETVQHYRDQQQMLESQIDKLKADSANAGLLAERARDEARQWRERAEATQENSGPILTPDPTTSAKAGASGSRSEILRALVEEELRPWIKSKSLMVTGREEGVVIQIPASLIFGQGGVDLTAQGKDVLLAVAQTASGTTHIRAMVHTDNVAPAGSLRERFPTNWELSAARAAGIARGLISAGMPDSQVEAVAVAESLPVAPNDSAENRARNRRVELQIQPLTKPVLDETRVASPVNAKPVGEPVKIPPSVAPVSDAQQDETAGSPVVDVTFPPKAVAEKQETSPIPAPAPDAPERPATTSGPRPILDN